MTHRPCLLPPDPHPGVLQTGDLRQAIKLPDGCDLNTWLAVATVDFYNITNVLYDPGGEGIASRLLFFVSRLGKMFQAQGLVAIIQCDFSDTPTPCRESKKKTTTSKAIFKTQNFVPVFPARSKQPYTYPDHVSPAPPTRCVTGCFLLSNMYECECICAWVCARKYAWMYKWLTFLFLWALETPPR